MTTDELAAKIKEFIEYKYECIFKGEIKVKQYGDTYDAIIILNNSDKPLNLLVEGTPEKFLEIVLQDLAERRLNLVTYFSGYKTEDEQRKNY